MHREHGKSELQNRVEKSLRKKRRAEQREGWEGRKKPGIARPAGAPYWLPRGPFWDRLSEGVKRAVGEVLEPADRRLVLEARDELENEPFSETSRPFNVPGNAATIGWRLGF